jgi:hypothetical protein
MNVGVISTYTQSQRYCRMLAFFSINIWVKTVKKWMQKDSFVRRVVSLSDLEVFKHSMRRLGKPQPPTQCRLQISGKDTADSIVQSFRYTLQ